MVEKHQVIYQLISLEVGALCAVWGGEHVTDGMEDAVRNGLAIKKRALE